MSTSGDPNSNNTQIILAIIALIGVLGGSFFQYLSQSSSSNSTTTPAPTPPVASPNLTTDPRKRIVVSIYQFKNLEGVSIANAHFSEMWGGSMLGPDTRGNSFKFSVDAKTAGKYKMYASYAAEKSRPVTITLGEETIFNDGLLKTTGCWKLECSQTLEQGDIILKKGKNDFSIKTEYIIPHIVGFEFRKQ